MRMKFVLALTMTLVAIGFSGGQVQAATYITLTGQVLDSKGNPVQPPSTAVAKVASGEVTGNLDSQGRYSINVPAGAGFDLTFVLYEQGSIIDSGKTFEVNRANPGFSNWTTKVSPQQEDKVINFKLPSFVQLDVKVTDAQNLLLSNSLVYMLDGNQNHNTYSLGGYSWTGIQRFSSASWFISRTGSFVFQVYPTDDFKGFAYWQVLNLDQPLQGVSVINSPAFPILNNKSVQLCLPINFGSTKSTPDSCLDNQVAAERVAKDELKKKELAALEDEKLRDFESVKADYERMMQRITELKAKYPNNSSLLGMESKMMKLPIVFGKELTTAKYNIESVNKWLDGNEKVWAKTAKSTISCVKGKLVKKVTAINPRCPSGYKVKS